MLVSSKRFGSRNSYDICTKLAMFLRIIKLALPEFLLDRKVRFMNGILNMYLQLFFFFFLFSPNLKGKYEMCLCKQLHWPRIMTSALVHSLTAPKLKIFIGGYVFGPACRGLASRRSLELWLSGLFRL